MTTFGIDASSANEQDKTGVQWYALRLIEHMKQQPLSTGERVVLYSKDPLQGELARLPDGWSSRVLPWKFPGWMQLRMSLEMLRNAPDVFFVPAKGVPRLCAKKTVTTIHDIGFLRLPDLWDAKTRKTLVRDHRRAIKKATLLLTPSVFTKQEILEQYSFSETRIVVTPLAADRELYKPAREEFILETRQNYRIGPHYVLFIGRLEKKKNVVALVRAFEQFKKDRGTGDPYELVLAGNPGIGFEQIKNYLEHTSLKDQIKTLGYVAEQEAVALMSGATAYAIPSWYEGFGLTPLEAMACGAPVIASDIPAHREVCADAAILVDPNATQAIAHALEQLVQDASLREQLQEKGFDRVNAFSWERTATQTWEALRSLV